MRFEWDRQKKLKNTSKHGIDFKTATKLWDDPNRVEIQAAFEQEKRYILIGQIQDKSWTAIFTIRSTTYRIISVRRARTKERLLYEESKTS